LGNIYEGHLNSFGSEVVCDVLINELVFFLIVFFVCFNLTSWCDSFTWTRIIY